MSYEGDSFSLGGRAHGTQIERHSAGYVSGYVVTPNGIVGVYAQGDADHDNYSRLDFAWQGRQYMRIWHKQRLSSRGLVTAANRFAREIVGGSHG